MANFGDAVVIPVVGLNYFYKAILNESVDATVVNFHKYMTDILLQKCYGQIENDFFEFVEAYKARYLDMPEMRSRAKRKLTPSLEANVKGIIERKAALESVLADLAHGKITTLRKLLKTFHGLFHIKRQKKLLSARVSLAEKKEIVKHAIELFTIRLDAMSEPTWKLIENVYRSKRSSSLLDDPIVLSRFLDESRQESILSPKDIFWHYLRVSTKGY